MVTYIKRNVPGYYVELPEALDPEVYADQGTTYQDFLEGKWVKLSDEQVKYRMDNPNASVSEVWNMEPYKQVLTLEELRTQKLLQLGQFDNSPNVNQFTINNVIPAWFTPSERTDHALSINAAKLTGQGTLVFAVGDQVLEVATDKAEYMLAAIQLYANACYMVTAKHRIAIEALETEEEIRAYDFTTGYPEKLNFDLV